mgnify:CR=1 FL=1
MHHKWNSAPSQKIPQQYKQQQQPQQQEQLQSHTLLLQMLTAVYRKPECLLLNLAPHHLSKRPKQHPHRGCMVRMCMARTVQTSTQDTTNPQATSRMLAMLQSRTLDPTQASMGATNQDSMQDMASAQIQGMGKPMTQAGLSSMDQTIMQGPWVSSRGSSMLDMGKVSMQLGVLTSMGRESSTQGTGRGSTEGQASSMQDTARSSMQGRESSTQDTGRTSTEEPASNTQGTGKGSTEGQGHSMQDMGRVRTAEGSSTQDMVKISTKEGTTAGMTNSSSTQAAAQSSTQDTAGKGSTQALQVKTIMQTTISMEGGASMGTGVPMGSMGGTQARWMTGHALCAMKRRTTNCGTCRTTAQSAVSTDCSSCCCCCCCCCCCSCCC